MAFKKAKPSEEAPSPATEVEKEKARKWFKKAADCRERRDYDFAIESYIHGLEFWADAVEEGHMPLRSLGIQRMQAGGKKPGMMEGMKRSTSGKDAKQAMLNAEYLLAKDPANGSYLDALLKNADRLELVDTIMWVTPLVLDSLKKDKKPSKARFKAFREVVVSAAERMLETDPAKATTLLEQAVASVDYIVARSPGDEDLRIEQRNLSGKLAITRGKYEEADSFRDSLRDADAQRVLHDADRSKQSDETLEATVAALQKAYEEDPTPQNLNRLVEVLRKTERKPEEDRAVKLLMSAYESSGNYSFKQTADDIRMRQLARQTRKQKARAKESDEADDKQQARLAALEEAQAQREIFAERVKKYPTDLRWKYQLGATLFKLSEFDEAIPVLQAAQADPKHRVRCRLLIGRAFHETGAHAQAADVLKETIDSYEISDDVSYELMYRLGLAYEADGRVDEAIDVLGRLAREDYNYAGGDARRRLQALQQQKKQSSS